ncbi:MAG TPA: dihydrolipoamide acetyltransferase family protein, partial [Acidimicrobiales bacterium]|nr:dihydrolipoamide acetyltransferase family protein [Acidimicrobiales bacterium]
QDETLFEVSTDKVDSEVPSVASGYLAEILVPEGETVDVGARLAVVTDEPPASGSDGDGSAPEAEAAPDQGAGEREAPDQPAEQAPAPAAAGADPSTEGDESPRPPRAEAEAKVRPEGDDGASGDGGRAAREPSGPSARGDDASPPARSGGLLLSPVVRRLVAEHDLDPSQIPGTGQEGRITRADVLAHLDKGGSRSKKATPAERQESPAPAADRAPAPPAPQGPTPVAPSAPSRAAAAPQPAAPGIRAGADDEVVPFSNIRRRTAEHMVRSQATAAHVLIATEVDFVGVDRARDAIRENFKAREGFSLTYLPFVARAVIDAIDEFPHVNASVGDDELIVHRRVHLGVAVDLNFEGLIVPVVHDAGDKRLPAIARSIAELARRARSRELTADDISGGTFTITNPGPFGTLLTAAVINQPQVAILATDGVRKRPVAVELPDGSDAVVVHPVGNLALSFDHRAFDGAYAAAFLARCKEILETRDWSEEL